jgi:hypothetical protein
MSHSQFHCIIRLYLDMHGLIFETSIWLLAGSTRYLSFRSWEEESLNEQCLTPSRPKQQQRRCYPIDTRLCLAFAQQTLQRNRSHGCPTFRWHVPPFPRFQSLKCHRLLPEGWRSRLLTSENLRCGLLSVADASIWQKLKAYTTIG